MKTTTIIVMAMLCVAITPAAAQFNALDAWSDPDHYATSTGVSGGASTIVPVRTPTAGGGATATGTGESGGGFGYPYHRPKTECPPYWLCW